MARAVKNCEPGKEFVFRLPNGVIIGKARNMNEFTGIIKNAPVESLLYHAKGRHFAPWLRMVGERRSAARINVVKVDKVTARTTLLRCLR